MNLFLLHIALSLVLALQLQDQPDSLKADTTKPDTVSVDIQKPDTTEVDTAAIQPAQTDTTTADTIQTVQKDTVAADPPDTPAPAMSDTVPAQAATDTATASPSDTTSATKPIPVFYSSAVHSRYARLFRNDTPGAVNTRIRDAPDAEELPSMKKSLSDDIQVLGWHPFWAENVLQSYDYGLLTMVAYYALEPDPQTGNAANTNNWLTTGLHQTARQQNSDINIFLTAVLQDSVKNRQFFSNDNAVINFIDVLTSQVDQAGADGAVIDFQNIPPGYGDNFLTMLQRLGQQFQQKGHKIILVAPALAVNSSFDTVKAAALADYLVIMGYDFYGKGSKFGPFSVLYDTALWDHQSIETAVTYLTGDGGLDPSTILVSLGWIGSLYEIQESDTTHIGYRPYRYMRSSFQSRDGRDELVKMSQADKASRSSRYSYRVADTGLERIFYFDTPDDWEIKLQWISWQNLGGAAVWTLADTRMEDGFWNKLADTYGQPPSSVITNYVQPTLSFAGDYWDMPYISLYVTIVLISLCLLACLLMYLTKSVPTLLQRFGIFIPAIITFITATAMLHDILLMSADPDEPGILAYTGLIAAALILGASIGLCIQLYYYDREGLP